MKVVSLALTLAMLCTTTYAQKTTIKWGEEFNLKKGSSDLRVVLADKNSAFLQESHPAMKSYFVVGATLRESASLVKVDKNLSEVFRNDFNKELRGKEFVQFFSCEDKLFLISSDYSKRDKTLSLYASAVDKNSGELTGEWREVASYQKEEKADDINFRITYNTDSTKMIIVSSIEGKERNEYRFQELNKNLKATANPFTISNEFESKKYQLEDVLYTNEQKVILVGRMYEYEEGKKKKEKFLDFMNYNIRIYDEKGKQRSEINTSINGKWLISTKLVQEKNNDLVLAAFYSNEKKGKTIDGMLVQRINVANGTVISTSDKPINNSFLSANVDNTDNDTDDDKDESKEEKKLRESISKLKDEGEGFSKYMQFRNIFYTADNGLIILAEYFHHFITTSQSYSAGANGTPGQWTSTTNYNYISGDLMMCKVDAAGNIAWLRIIPKKQREVIQSSGRIYGSGFQYTPSYFMAGNRPFYSGFGAIQTGNTIQIIFNDNTKNANIIQAGQKAKAINRFAKSDCFVLNVNELTGELNRKLFFTNSDVPTAMPRLGVVFGNDMYMVGKTDRIFGKSKVALAKITVK
ncbi:hypothetical protein [Chitinophaga polysaccharea]|uniref:hypothetical protein n=1 Tax=Chitinophaga polysaccharea TaxID=1293035 RepID=UPI001157BACE|nr:hypothetical protein [Chitinophaga polysaccharea]